MQSAEFLLQGFGLRLETLEILTLLLEGVNALGESCPAFFIPLGKTRRPVRAHQCHDRSDKDNPHNNEDHEYEEAFIHGCGSGYLATHPNTEMAGKQRRGAGTVLKDG